VIVELVHQWTKFSYWRRRSTACSADSSTESISARARRRRCDSEEAPCCRRDTQSAWNMNIVSSSS
jgi:hypothetical protein